MINSNIKNSVEISIQNGHINKAINELLSNIDYFSTEYSTQIRILSGKLEKADRDRDLNLITYDQHDAISSAVANGPLNIININPSNVDRQKNITISSVNRIYFSKNKSDSTYNIEIIVKNEGNNDYFLETLKITYQWNKSVKNFWKGLEGALGVAPPHITYIDVEIRLDEINLGQFDISGLSNDESTSWFREVKGGVFLQSEKKGNMNIHIPIYKNIENNSISNFILKIDPLKIRDGKIKTLPPFTKRKVQSDITTQLEVFSLLYFGGQTTYQSINDRPFLIKNYLEWCDIL